MVMRVGGLATGMDIEAMVEKLMSAERMPLERMNQDHTQLEWKRDAFREMNRSLLELEQLARDMRLPSTYVPKKATSSQEGAVTATASSGAPEGSYSIGVSQLATSAISKSENTFTKDHKFAGDSEITISTFSDAGEKVDHIIEIKDGESLDDVLKKINDNDVNIRAFYDHQSKSIIMETTRTGKYNKDENGAEIIFDSNAQELFSMGKVDGGTDAKFTYNGLELSSKHNAYEMNGIHFGFNNVTEGKAQIRVSNDVESSFDKIVAFVEKYNEVVDKLHGSQQEEKHRDYKPLTDEQKKEMSEDEIKKWEEKAKSGAIRGESSITNGLYSMRGSWYANVETGTDLKSMTQLGITTSANYMDGGKLEIDEDKLRAALRDHPEDVQKLFVNSSKDNDRGIANRLSDSISATMKQIEKQAGKDYHTLENYNIGKEMKSLNERISDFEERMLKVENRYWDQFTQMEKAIQRLNDQSAQLFSQFGQ